MSYLDLQVSLLELVEPQWERVIAFDMETDTRHGGYLTGERILVISFARRVSGEFLESDGIEIKTLFLEEDSDDSEMDLLLRLGREIGEIEPICILGYGIRQYDIPLLAIKKQRYGELIKNRREFWKLVDFTESTIHIDLYHILKYKRYKRFDQVVESEEFATLPLKRSKNIVASRGIKKAQEIYKLWKKRESKLKEYVEGDVHDSLLIAEKILLEANKWYSFI
ncbi:hypothetical protein DRN63_04735 [Nanoarchaeota archaeon]|nr:MAG: hypothetical protein DRN63_04735 [Nanoarchaeota archaeon]